MPLGKQYKVFITETAGKMLGEKMQYIAEQLSEPAIAQNWLARLLKFFESELTTFPKKFPLYNGDRYRIVVYRNDVVIYEVDDEKLMVYIDLVCTKGRNIEHLLKKGGICYD